MDKLAKLPTARWLTAPDQLPDIESYVNAATRSRKVPVLVAYYFPGRDCGKYSAGGAPNEAAYRDFIGQFAEALGNARTIVILEPDALPGISASNDQGNPCVARQEQANRYALLKQAVNRLKQQKNTNVYIDAGNSAWITNHKQLASWLEQSGVTDADGFSLNVSNFQTTADTIRYGEKVARYVRDAHFVIDTSRNGLGPYTNTQFPTHSWCNPPGRALGHYPTTKTGNRLVDAYLYIKYPGESDGQDPEPGKCANGPAAGVWWPEYALELIERWPKDLQP
jgi:endoglucanase